jgi:DNA-directed RNA polymerase beta' subunit
MLSIKPRDINADFNERHLITNHEALNNDFKFTPDGVFSEKIFGSMANGIDYSCAPHCGKYQGEFNLGHECEDCNTKVEYRGLQLSKEGWIDLHYPIIHPVFYRYLKKIIGATNLEKIINYKGRIKVTGEIIEAPMEHPYHEIGMFKFLEHFEEIVESFMDRKKEKDRAKLKDWAFIQAHQDMVFVDKYPIINSRLRPATVINGEFSFDAINNLYNNIIRSADILKNLSELEQNDMNILSLVFKNQMLVNELFDTIIDTLSNKEGYIRGSLMGCRLNFSSRNVITPLSGKFGMNDCVMPYATAIELLRPLIIRKLQKVKKVSISQAHKMWFDATLIYNKLVHTIMKELVAQDNIRILLNRNPTISVGSILQLQIVDIKGDMNDKTLSISNLVLPCISGDYDGDVLNIVMLFSKSFVELFKPYAPSNLVIDTDSGEFNGNFKPFKDIEIGLQSLVN